MIEEPFPQRRFYAPGGAVDKVAPQKTAQGDEGHKAHHQGAEDENFLPHKVPGAYQVHRPAYKLGDDDLGGIHDNQADQAPEVMAPVGGKVGDKAFIDPEGSPGAFFPRGLITGHTILFSASLLAVSGPK
jgi:hypothetical protein